jgi:hypothetical protein
MNRAKGGPGRPARAAGPSVALALVAMVISGCTGGDGAGRPQPGAAKPGGEAGPDGLTVWVVDGYRTGIAIALNDLRKGKDRTVAVTRRDATRQAGIGLFEVVRDLLDEDHVQPMYPFSIRVCEPRRCWTVDFKFAKEQSLRDAWKPLFDCAASLGTEDPTPLEGFVRRYPSVGGSRFWGWLPDRVASSLRPLAWPPWLRGPARPEWLANLDWRDELAGDICCRQSDARLVILGPETSDEVPALWFLLAAAEAADGGDWTPPMISVSATWSALADPGRLVGLGTPDASAGYLSWATTLGRALGFSADDDHFRYASAGDRARIAMATAELARIAPQFCPLARSDADLVDQVHEELYEIRGYRRIGVLYRDSQPVERSAPGGPLDPGLSRQLYGPGLSDEFRKKGRASGSDGRVYLDSPFRKAPIRTEPGDYDARLAAWEAELPEELRPVLRVFEREGVGAVGVFGDSADEKAAVLKVVRQELPGVQLFTSDPDWKLESPTPPRETMEAGPSAARPPDDYPLNGLMVFAGAVPSEDWVRARFQELNEVVLLDTKRPFLPDVFDCATAHVVKRLIELAGEGGTEVFRSAPALRGRLREGSHIVDDPRIIRSEREICRHQGRELMLLSAGRLHPMREPKWLSEHSAVFLGVLLTLASLLWFVRSRKPTPAPTGGAPDPAASPAGPTPGGDADAASPPRMLYGRLSLGNDAVGRPSRGSFRATTLFAILFLLPILAVMFDSALSPQTSPSLMPDGHSVLPSLLLFLVVAWLSARLPVEFAQQVRWYGHARVPRTSLLLDWGRCRSEDEAAFLDDVIRWKEERVDRFLGLDGLKLAVSATLALALTALDASAGLPVRRGSATWWVALAYEFGMLLAVLSAALTFGDMLAAVIALGRPGTFRGPAAREGPGVPARALTMMDPEALRRLGTEFIRVVASGLLIFTLLLLARLPWVGMARWRWSLSLWDWQVALLPAAALLLLAWAASSPGPLGESDRRRRALPWAWASPVLALVVVAGFVWSSAGWKDSTLPLGAILFGVGLAFIVGYWYQCNTTFRRLIREVKDARLAELWAQREQHAPPPGTPSFEERRDAIVAIPDDPWAPAASWRARVALLTTIATPIISLFLGNWGDTIGKVVNAVFNR